MRRRAPLALALIGPAAGSSPPGNTNSWPSNFLRSASSRGHNKSGELQEAVTPQPHGGTGSTSTHVPSRGSDSRNTNKRRRDGTSSAASIESRSPTEESSEQMSDWPASERGADSRFPDAPGVDQNLWFHGNQVSSGRSTSGVALQVLDAALSSWPSGIGNQDPDAFQLLLHSMPHSTPHSAGPASAGPSGGLRGRGHAGESFCSSQGEPGNNYGPELGRTRVYSGHSSGAGLFGGSSSCYGGGYYGGDTNSVSRNDWETCSDDGGFLSKRAKVTPQIDSRDGEPLETCLHNDVPDGILTTASFTGPDHVMHPPPELEEEGEPGLSPGAVKRLWLKSTEKTQPQMLCKYMRQTLREREKKKNKEKQGDGASSVTTLGSSPQIPHPEPRLRLKESRQQFDDMSLMALAYPDLNYEKVRILYELLKLNGPDPEKRDLFLSHRVREGSSCEDTYHTMLDDSMSGGAPAPSSSSHHVSSKKRTFCIEHETGALILRPEDMDDEEGDDESDDEQFLEAGDNNPIAPRQERPARRLTLSHLTLLKLSFLTIEERRAAPKPENNNGIACSANRGLRKKGTSSEKTTAAPKDTQSSSEKVTQPPLSATPSGESSGESGGSIIAEVAAMHLSEMEPCRLGEGRRCEHCVICTGRPFDTLLLSVGGQEWVDELVRYIEGVFLAGMLREARYRDLDAFTQIYALLKRYNMHQSVLEVIDTMRDLRKYDLRYVLRHMAGEPQPGTVGDGSELIG